MIRHIEIIHICYVVWKIETYKIDENTQHQ